jgi:DNA-binding IclR family transcriptional regulator
VAAVSLSGPTERLFGDRHDEIAAGVVRAASELSARLGSRPPEHSA